MTTADNFTEIARKREPSLPIGKAKELNQLANSKWKEHQVLFSEVHNVVIKVNPHFRMPYNIVEGKESPLGVIVKDTFAQFNSKPVKLEPRQHVLEYWNGHSRSFIVARLSFSDDDHSSYRDIDIKGAGNVQSLPYHSELGITEVMTGEPYLREGERTGLVEKEAALYDYEMTEKVHNLGVRTYRILALIELKDELLKRKLRGTGFTPVIEVRAFGTKLRIGNFEDKNNILVIDDAKELVMQESGKGTLSDQEYFDWFIQALAKNIGLMHKNGLKHGGLWEHNITLDCRLVDLDSAGAMTKEKERDKDIENSEWSLFGLADKLFGYKMHTADIEDSREMKYIKEKFKATYDSFVI